MPVPTIRTAKIWEGSNPTFLDRLVNAAGTVLTSDDVVNFDLRVWNSNERRDGKWIEEAALPTNVVFDELATDEGWTRDSTGWNVKYTLDYADFSAHGAKTYRFEFVFHTNTFGDIPIVWDVQVEGLRSV